MIWLALLLMAGITFSCRYAFLARSLKFRMHPRIQRMLDYAAPSVMTAMWVPIVFESSPGNLQLHLDSPFLWAGLLTLLLSLVFRNTLAIVGLGMLSFFAIKFLMGA